MNDQEKITLALTGIQEELKNLNESHKQILKTLEWINESIRILVEVQKTLR